MPNILTQSKVIITPENLSFHIDKTAWYAVNITARLKSEKQRGEKETDDEELTIELDYTTFPKPNADNNLKDAPAAFSGGSQHNQEKTIRIIVVLGLGKHTLTLSPQYQAEVISVWYEPLILANNKISLKLNETSKNRSEQPWMTFALVSPHFTQVTIKAKVWWHFFNGDDVQIRINSVIISHATNIRRHKHWLFHARAILDIFGREQVETRALSATSSDPKISYIELWADRTPLLQKIVFEGENLQREIELTSQLHQYSTGPNRENFNQYDQIIKNVVSKLNQEFSEQDYPPSNHLDPNLVKAMAYVESKVGQYQALSGNYPAFPDVIQIADPRNPAIHTLNNDGWVDPTTGQKAEEYTWTSKHITIMDYEGKAKVTTVADSIYWGAVWLYHKAEAIKEDGSRSWRSWSEAVTRYNGGGDARYSKKVYDIYEKGDWK